MWNKSKKGITLIELVLALSIMSFVGFAVFRAFSSGIDMWQWQQSNKTRGDVGIFFEKISRDIGNVLIGPHESFYGDSSNVIFLKHNTDLLFLTAKEVKDAGIPWQSPMDHVEYSYLSDKGMVVRAVKKFSDTEFASPVVVLRDVGDVKFSFFVNDPESGHMAMSKKVEDEFPVAVEVEVTFNDTFSTSGETQRVYKKFIDIPAKI